MKNMTNYEIPRTPEQSTPDQAQAVVAHIDRVLVNVKARLGPEGIKNHSAPRKTRWHQDVLFIRQPEGESNVDDPSVLNLGGVAWDNEDGSRTFYIVEMTEAFEPHLTKHTYPPAGRQPLIMPGDSPASMLIAATEVVPTIGQEHQARMQERALGLHYVSQEEAAALIERLGQVEPAPYRAW
jgi:hypothetical protein